MSIVFLRSDSSLYPAVVGEQRVGIAASPVAAACVSSAQRGVAIASGSSHGSSLILLRVLQGRQATRASLGVGDGEELASSGLVCVVFGKRDSTSMLFLVSSIDGANRSSDTGRRVGVFTRASGPNRCRESSVGGTLVVVHHNIVGCLLLGLIKSKLFRARDENGAQSSKAICSTIISFFKLAALPYIPNKGIAGGVAGALSGRSKPLAELRALTI